MRRLASTECVADALREASARLASGGSDAPGLEARILLERALGKSRIWVYQNPTFVLDAARRDQFQALVSRRLAGEPLAYIVGEREFYGRAFGVDARVLIPRPETEILLEHALAFARQNFASADAQPPLPLGEGGSEGVHRGAVSWDALTLTLSQKERGFDARPLIVDVGTGSGVLGISLALEIPTARVILLDRSSDALDVARANCQRHGVDGRVEVIESDLLSALEAPADLIVANLPYIPLGDLASLQTEVRREPLAALDGGPDGLDLYRRLFAQAATRLAPGGGLFAEIGAGQGSQATALARASLPGYDVHCHLDLESRDRVIAAIPRLE